jgi:RsiW-degrading membrane proteinase PrsW (M82 family)
MPQIQGSGIFISIIVAFLLGGVWVRFLYQIDSFEPEDKKITLLNFVAGCCTPLLIEPVIGLSPFVSDISRNELFYYALIRVAAIEEFVKILPFFLFLSFSKQVNESVDYVKYPAVAGVGFATVENVLYSLNYGVDILNIRGLLCVSGHLIYSSMIGYAVWRSLSYDLAIRPLIMLLGFGAAVVFHGFYDYFLFLAEATRVGVISIMSIGVMAMAAKAFQVMMHHVVRNSAFFQPHLLQKIQDSAFSLFLGLMGIYFFIGFYKIMFYGFDVGFQFLFDNFILIMAGTSIVTSLLYLDSKKIIIGRKSG